MKKHVELIICDTCEKEITVYQEIEIQDKNDSKRDVASGRSEYMHYTVDLCVPCLVNWLELGIALLPKEYVERAKSISKDYRYG